MKKILFLGIVVIVFVACSTDSPFKLTEDIGSISIDLRDTVRFSYFLPGTGTFEFTQSSARSKEKNNLETMVRIKDNSGDSSIINFELYVFDNEDFTNNSLDFNANASVKKQNDEYTLLASKGEAKINDNNFHLAQFSEEQIDLSGSYSGTVRVFIENEEDMSGEGDTSDGTSGEDEEDSEEGDGQDDSTDEDNDDSGDGNGEDDSEDVEDETQDGEEDQNNTETTLEIFNVIGNIDLNNTLFLLSTQDDTEFTTLSGILLNSSSPIFAGKFKKDTTSQDITGTFDDSSQGRIVLQIEFTANTETKNLSIELTKNP